MSADDYVELLPATWRAINRYGVKIGHRTYDAEELNGLRRQRSGLAEHKDLWEVHYDPYDITRIWVRHHWNGGWITCYWKHLRSAPVPFGEMAWNHALGAMRAEGRDAQEEQVAAAAADLLQRAHQGPAGKADARERRVAARTRASAPSLPADLHPPGRQPAPANETEELEPDEPLAEVIPLAVFDARAEARKRW